MARPSLREYFFPTKGIRFVAPAILLILLLFFFVNGPLLFGDLWTSGGFVGGFSNVILLYILLLFGAFLLYPKLLTEDPKAPLWLELAAYIGPAIGINVLMLLSGIRISLGPSDPAFSYQIIALQVGITGVEEYFFRAALWYRKLGPVYSSGIFAGFHALAYGLSPIPLVFAFMVGAMFFIIYEQTREKYGTSINAGLHAGYNLGLLSISLIPGLF